MQSDCNTETTKATRSGWRKRVARLFAGLVVVLIAFVAVASISSVDLAAQPRFPSDKVVPDDAWPARDSWQALDNTGTGELLSDQGQFGQCRIFSQGADKEDANTNNFMLVTNAFSNKEREIKLQGMSGAAFAGPWSHFELELVGQNLSFAQVIPASGPKANGVLFYLGSIDVFSSGERAALRVASDRGWNVVACTIGMDFAASERVPVNDWGATNLANRIDNHLSDRACALEAMIQYLEVKRPEFFTGPRVIVGTSAGAIALPTVVAKVGAVDAAVLIGGGENVAQIVESSPLFSGHIDLVEEVVDRSNPKHTIVSTVLCKAPEKRRKFVEQVKQRSKLDPHRTAAVLHGTPVLMLQAEYDRIVSAQTGQALYESLQSPERWRYHTGHLGLIAIVPWKIGYVMDWIEKAVVEEPAAKLSEKKRQKKKGVREGVG